jgi:biopolymer transport protein ExbB
MRPGGSRPRSEGLFGTPLPHSRREQCCDVASSLRQGGVFVRGQPLSLIGVVQMIKHFGYRVMRAAGIGLLLSGLGLGVVATAGAQTPPPPAPVTDAPPPPPGTAPAAAPAAAPAPAQAMPIDTAIGLPIAPVQASGSAEAPPPPKKRFEACASKDDVYGGKPHPYKDQDTSKPDCILTKMGDILGMGLNIPIKQDQEFALQNLFFIAHPVVQIVMIGLAIASVISWAILIAKLISFASLNSRTTSFLNGFRASNAPLRQLAQQVKGKDRSNPMVAMLDAAANEIDTTFASGDASTGEKREHLTQRVAAAMNIAQSSNSADLSSGMAFLATTGSIATFVGLFGTVWGIMYSFIGIAQSKSTNLAVVAPGIAEALFATAIGLFAAIPAVVFYNIFSRRIAAYNTRLDNFSGELLLRVSRQLDQSAT